MKSHRRAATEGKARISPALLVIPAPNPELRHLIRWMRSTGFTPVLIALLGFGLIAGAVGCPLWMVSTTQQDHMPCSHENSSSPERCPLAICQASSPYLVAHLGTSTLPLLVELDAGTNEPTISWGPLTVAHSLRAQNESPPAASGSLFLRTHSLLI